MIKFLDLQKINAQYATQLKAAAAEVIDSGWYLQGERTRRFEQQLKELTGAPHCVTVANGLDALRMILKAYIQMGVMQPGDEVIAPANTFIATVLAITDNRLKPVLVEPALDTYNIDIEQIERFISERTRAIMVVHLYGRTVWSEKLEALAEKYNLKIVEDNAQAIGARWRGKSTGSLGDAAGLSFYPGKNLGALGDSGAVLTRDARLAQIVRALGSYGSEKKYVNDFMGLNSRMDEIQAAFLGVKIGYLMAENERRRQIADYYCQHIANPKVVLPQQPQDPMEHVYHLFVVRVADREGFQRYLSDNGIQTLVHYPIPPHKQACYRDWNGLSFPVTERIHNEVVSLPMSAVLTDDEAARVVEVINRY